jgi:hypothetical protein
MENYIEQTINEKVCASHYRIDRVRNHISGFDGKQKPIQARKGNILQAANLLNINILQVRNL